MIHKLTHESFGMPVSEVERMIGDYYDFHFDTLREIAGVVKGEENVASVLVRITNPRGIEMSAMLDLWHDSNGSPYFTESEACFACDEDKMIKRWEDGFDG